MIDFIALAFIVVFWCVGDHKNAWVRDWLIPFIVGICVFLHHPLDEWSRDLLLAFLTAGACNIIRFGYGAYDPINDDKPSLLAQLTKDKGGWWIRAIWGFVVGMICFIPAIWMLGGPYIAGWITLKAGLFATQLALICFAVTRLRWSVTPTGIAIGLSFGSIIFFLK
jgi:hypothetical protein